MRILSMNRSLLPALLFCAELSFSFLFFVPGLNQALAQDAQVDAVAVENDATAITQPTPTITPTPLPQSGSLAGSWNSTMGGQVAPEVWGGIEIAGTPSAPIAGSISKTGSNSWTARVFNNSGDSYSVSIAIEQINSRGGTTRIDHLSIIVPAGKAVEREVKAHPSTTSAQIEMKGWKKVGR